MHAMYQTINLFPVKLLIELNIKNLQLRNAEFRENALISTNLHVTI